MKNIITIALASAALVIPGIAIATQQDARAPKGDVTLAEVQQHSAERFAELDFNGDGNITQAEMEAFKEQRRDQRFAQLDANSDGAVTQDEMEAHRQQRMEKRGERAERMGKRGGNRGMRGRRGGGFERLDANNDGSVSLAEFQARPLRMFEAADADGNGVVTEAEREQARSTMREGRRGMRNR